MAPCEVIIIHRQAALGGVAAVRDTEKYDGWKKRKALSGKHCDAFLYCEAALPPAPAVKHHRCPPYCRVITFPAENEIRCAMKTDDPL